MSDDAVQDVVASVLLVALAVVVSGAFGVLLRARLVPDERYAADLDLRLGPGADGAWGSGNEVLRVGHVGGEALRADALTLLTRIGTVVDRRAPTAAAPFADGSFSVGESWAITLNVPRGAEFSAAVFAGPSGRAHMLEQLELEAVA